MILCVPTMEPEGQEWPSLGPQVVNWIEGKLVFGPGDLRGQRAQVDPEKRALLERMYEVYPREHEKSGRRRFKRVALSLRKGSAKTELAAWIAAAELHQKAPVRCIGWDDRHCGVHGKVRRKGATCRCVPIGSGVRDPFIPLLAYTEEQSEELCYGALKVILELSRVAKDFDIGLERIMRVRGDGKALAVATAPGPRDGARTTFQVGDETHRLVLPRQRKAWETMLANQPKRKLSDAWSLETTTAYAPGEQSVAERTQHYAQAVAEGRVKDSRLFFFHRQASDVDVSTGKAWDLTDPAAVRRAVLEASGPVSEWSDVDAIVEQWNDPTSDRTYLERVWLNRPVKAAEKAFNVEAWRRLARAPIGGQPYRPPRGALIALGFDGARFHDSTAIVGTEIETGYQWLLGLWEQDPLDPKWEVPEDEVCQVVEDAFARWRVWRFYCDPPYWETVVAAWAGLHGKETVVFFLTNRYRQMADAVRGFTNALVDGGLSHDGSPDYARHIGNAHRRPLNQRDEEGRPLWVIQKERPDSPLKIDAAAAGVLSWRARTDALTNGARASGPSIWDQRAAAGEEVLPCV